MQFIASSRKKFFLFETYSVVDYFTIPPAFVSMLLDRNWSGEWVSVHCNSAVIYKPSIFFHSFGKKRKSKRRASNFGKYFPSNPKGKNSKISARLLPVRHYPAFRMFYFYKFNQRDSLIYGWPPSSRMIFSADQCFRIGEPEFFSNLEENSN